MTTTINCIDDIEREVNQLLKGVWQAQNPVNFDKILTVRIDINDKICALYKFAHDCRNRFPAPDAYIKFCEDIEMISDAMRNHQCRWTSIAIARSRAVYLESCRQVEHVVRVWIRDMKNQLGPVLQLSEMPADAA